MPEQLASTSLSSVAVVLTTGSRPAELKCSLRSLHESGLPDWLVVWNSSDPPQLDLDAGEWISAGQNLGIPGGRNYGAANSTSDIIIFLDDDAEVLTPDLWERTDKFFTQHPRCAVISFRIVDEDGISARRHNPRLGHFLADKPGTVGTFLGGACAIRRSAFEACGGYDDSFFYAMEEQDLAWRLFNSGYFVHYAPEILVRHPRTLPSRHSDALEKTWENRVSCAVKSLPYPIVPLYLLAHGVRSLRSGLSLRWAVKTALKQANNQRGSRKPMTWRTVLKLTASGRPPIF